MSRELALEIAPADAKKLLDDGEAVALIDCREAGEYQICRIEGAELIPMNTVPAQLQRLDALSDEKRLIVYCHHGMRSLSVVNWLRKQGVENCQSLSGGIDRWSASVDPKVPRY